VVKGSIPDTPRRRGAEAPWAGDRTLIQGGVAAALRASEPEDLRLLGQLGLLFQGHLAEVRGELLGVRPGDRDHQLLLFRIEVFRAQDLAGQLGAADGVRGHEATPIAVDGLLALLLDLGLSGMDHEKALAGELGVGVDLGLDLGLGREGVEVAVHRMAPCDCAGSPACAREAGTPGLSRRSPPLSGAAPRPIPGTRAAARSSRRPLRPHTGPGAPTSTYPYLHHTIMYPYITMYGGVCMGWIHTHTV